MIKSIAQGGTGILKETDERELTETAAGLGVPIEDLTYQDELIYYNKFPLNLNKATENDLINFPLFNIEESKKIIAYRSSNEGIVDINELLVLGFDKRKIDQLSKYIIINETINDLPHKNFKNRNSHHILYRLKSNFHNNYSPKHLLRYRYLPSKKLDIGFTFENDEGENFFTSSKLNRDFQPRYGFDFYSGYLSMKFDGFVRELIIGDYIMNWGQGLVSWSGFGFGKSALILTPIKTARSLIKYSSTDENRFYRGTAIHYKWKRWDVYHFISTKRIDANKSDTGSHFSTIVNTGIHRTEKELESKNALGEFIIGKRVARNIQHGIIGLNVLYTKLNHPFVPEKRPDLLFNFNGQSIMNTSIDYRYSKKYWQLFGENAINSDKKHALLNGVILTPNEAISIVFLHRNYSKGYHSFYANGFGEKPNTRNEIGTYIGFDWAFHPKWQLQTYADFYKHPWLQFREDAPQQGKDFLTRITYSPSQSIQVYARVQREKKKRHELGSRTHYETKTRFRIHLKNDISPYLSCQTRFESVYFNDFDLQIGQLLYQDISYRFRRKIKLTTRVAMFDCPSFNTAIYTYENDVLYSFSVPAYHGTGMRYYLLLRYKPASRLNFWIKYGRFHYINSNDPNIGIKQSTSTITFQTKYVF